MLSSKSPRVFISYSHRGKGPEWKLKLLRALHVFESQHLLDIWQDGKIRVSSFWDDDIKKAMSQADIAIVLLTQESLESEYILNFEFPHLRDRQLHDKLTVFPVVCEECDWRSHDWLRATQAPNGSNPLSTLSSQAQDRIFRQLATDVAEQLSKVALADITAETATDTRLYLDKFPLTRGPDLREDKLIGREQELALLDLAFTQPHTAIVSLVAWGGVGKTMLVQHWLRRLESEQWRGTRQVYAWSFYSQGTTEDRQASEDMFLAHALEWFGVQCEPTLSPWEKGRLLADAVAIGRTLLILDGIEPLQYPPGPMGGQLRAPGVQSLLRNVARMLPRSEHQGLCLATTREPLADLVDSQRHDGGTWGSVLRVNLGNLTDDAGAALLHHAGAKHAGAAEIKPDDSELVAASRDVDGHALTLNLLGRFLARAHSGDIRQRDLVKFEDADRTIQGGTTFRMLAAFRNWFARSGEFGARQLAVLQIVSLFDRPAGAGCIAELRKMPIIQGLTDSLFVRHTSVQSSENTARPISDEEWNCAVSFLSDFCLVVNNIAARIEDCTLECHPLVREYFVASLSEHHCTYHHAHMRVCTYLLDSILDNRRPALASLGPMYQAIWHACQAGEQQIACDNIYKKHILNYNEYFSVKMVGAFSDEAAALHAIGGKSSKLRGDLFPNDRAWIKSQSAYTLRAHARIESASTEMMQSAADYLSIHDLVNASIVTDNASDLKCTLGKLGDSLELARTAILLAQRAKDTYRAAAAAAGQANTLLAHGDFAEAIQTFQLAERLQALDDPRYQLLYSRPGFLWNECMLHPIEVLAWRMSLNEDDERDSPSVCEELSLIDCVVGRVQSDMREASILLDVSLNKLIIVLSSILENVLKRTVSASHISMMQYAQEAEASIRKSGRTDQYPLFLRRAAWARWLANDVGGAVENLNEAMEIALRGPMRLEHVDILLYRARLFFRGSIYPWKSPQDDLAVAEKLINECGYHRRDQELSDAKRAILGKVV